MAINNTQNRVKVEAALRYLWGAQAQPVNALPLTTEALLHGLDDRDVSAALELLQQQAEDPAYVGGTPISNVIRQAKRGTRPEERKECICADGDVRLLIYRNYDRYPFINDDCVDSCSRCNNGRRDPGGKWYDRLVMGRGTKLREDATEEQKEEWIRGLLVAVATFSFTNPRWKKYIKWPEDKMTMTQSLKKRGLWPVIVDEAWVAVDPDGDHIDQMKDYFMRGLKNERT